ncbi:hypothetical protein TNCV_4418511 [Trichonephila clavipes]|nr:hypothetical protein TNCV_4418511 [Trichonephila clavipes]
MSEGELIKCTGMNGDGGGGQRHLPPSQQTRRRQTTRSTSWRKSTTPRAGALIKNMFPDKILEANSQVQIVKLGGHQTCLSINRLWHELCDMMRRLVGTTAPGHHDSSIQE